MVNGRLKHFVLLAAESDGNLLSITSLEREGGGREEEKEGERERGKGERMKESEGERGREKDGEREGGNGRERGRERERMNAAREGRPIAPPSVHPSLCLSKGLWRAVQYSLWLSV